MRTLILVPFLAACGNDHIITPDRISVNAPSPGSVMGRVCDASGSNWLPDAVVYTHLFDSDDKLYDTRVAYTDNNGWWLLDDLPAEVEYKVFVQLGGELLESHTVWLGDGEDVVLEEPACFEPLSLDVAVVTGDYDDFEEVLDGMGFANYLLVPGNDAQELTSFLMEGDLDSFDIIFFDGGHIESGIIYEADPDAPTGLPAAIMDRLRAYVADGGSLYASDWAYDVVEIAYPDRIDFVGSDLTPNAAQVGEYGLIDAAVTDSALAEYLGTDTMRIEYDLPVWPTMVSVADSVSTHVSGSVEYRDGQYTYSLSAVPMLVSFSSGQGRVAFSSFRVAKNSSQELLLSLQYLMYNL